MKHILLPWELPAEYTHSFLPFLTVSRGGVSDQGAIGSGTILFSQISNPPYTSAISARNEQRNQGIHLFLDVSHPWDFLQRDACIFKRI